MWLPGQHHPFLACSVLWSEWVLSSSLWWMELSVCHLTPLHSRTQSLHLTLQEDSTIAITLHWLPGFLNTRFATQGFLSQKENSDKRKNIYEAVGIERRNSKKNRKYFTAFCKGWWISETKNKKEANRVKVWCLLYLENDPLYCSSLQNINLKKQTWKK